jgi:hypothetical protein
LIEKHPIGGERWYAFSIFVPPDWEPLSRNEVVAQWKHTNDEDLGETEGSPPLALRIERDDWLINCRWDSRRASDKEHPEGKAKIVRARLARGRWTDWAFRYRTSYREDGLVEVWKDGRPLARRAGPNCYNDEVGLYFKWGIYHTDGHRVLWNDELRIGEDESALGDLAPHANTAGSASRAK